MPNLTRKSLREASKRTKIVDDPDHPGQPKDVSPLALVRSRDDVEHIRRVIAGLKETSAEGQAAWEYWDGFEHGLRWLLEVDSNSPLTGLLEKEVVNES